MSSQETSYKFPPPPIRSIPPLSPAAFIHNKSYRWSENTSRTEKSLENDAHYRRPSSQMKNDNFVLAQGGDSVRKHIPKGRIRDLAAAFDQKVRETSQRNDLPQSSYQVGHTRRVDDLQFEKNNNRPLSGDANFDQQDRRQDRRTFDESLPSDPPLGKVFPTHTATIISRKTYGNGDYAYESSVITTDQYTSKTSTDPMNRDSIDRGDILDKSIVYEHSIELNSSQESECKNKTLRSISRPPNHATSTPRNPREDVHAELLRYFNRETPIRDCTQLETPVSRRNDRRLTQAITAASLREPLPSRSSSLGPSSRDNLRVELFPRTPKKEAGNRSCDVNGNLVQKKEPDEKRNSVEIDKISMSRDEEGQNFVDLSFEKQEPVKCQEPIYAVPLKKSERSQADQRKLRVGYPFSDIPEENTIHSKIDDYFDFVEEAYAERVYYHQTSEENFEEKGVDCRGLDGKADPRNYTRTASYHSIDKPDDRNDTYQELELPPKSNRDSFDDVDGTSGAGISVQEIEPRYSWSPILTTPYAGQSVTEYRVNDREGHPTAEKVVLNRAIQPCALATSTPMGTLAFRRRPNDHADTDKSFVSSISTMSTSDKKTDTKRQIAKLVRNIETTKRLVQAAEVTVCEGKRSKETPVERAQLTAQRQLLMYRERLRLQTDELKRLQALSVVRHPPPPVAREFKSHLVISSIGVHLNKNFCQRQFENSSYAFLVLLKCRTEVEATGVISLLANYQTRLHVLNFNEHIHFSNLPVDFAISIEVYMMRMAEELQKNLLVPSSAQRKAKPHSQQKTLPYEVPDCEFNCCGKMTLDRAACGDRMFYLDDVVYPLEGTVKLISHCSSLPEAIDVEYRGFLTIYQKINGMECWERYWAMLNRGIIFMWTQPSDEKSGKGPVSQIDLTKCTNHSVSPNSMDVCSRVNSFSIELLINSSPTLIEKKRVLLCTDSEDVMNSWLSAINETLLVLRGVL
ncbi:unnamed protein product [Caenorhabditis auriculariae]|uniref:PH domain-containing protein n=1 Tax=Caenorhabditis auriculariae TaxID=2777116 RepID=A0A8S1HBY6_9PELO|nr:unnamed protein product [Caenorhabditis auriculariae]